MSRLWRQHAAAAGTQMITIVTSTGHVNDWKAGKNKGRKYRLGNCDLLLIDEHSFMNWLLLVETCLAEAQRNLYLISLRTGSTLSLWIEIFSSSVLHFYRSNPREMHTHIALHRQIRSIVDSVHSLEFEEEDVSGRVDKKSLLFHLRLVSTRASLLVSWKSTPTIYFTLTALSTDK